jgi:hypothetical protein
MQPRQPARCPRCADRGGRGQLFRDQDGDAACLQCGFVVPPPDPLPLVVDRARRRLASRQATDRPEAAGVREEAATE